MTLAGDAQPLFFPTFDKNAPSLNPFPESLAQAQEGSAPPRMNPSHSTQQTALLGVCGCLDRVPQEPPGWQSPPHPAGRARILSRN